jgi:hypothetical protein
MAATSIVKVEGLDWTALREAYVRVRATLGDKVDGGCLPRWGPADGGAWLSTESYRVDLAFFHGTEDRRTRSVFQASYYGTIPEDDLTLLTAVLSNPPLPIAE